MKKITFTLVLLLLWSVNGFADKEIRLKGIFQGENLFVMNPFAPSGVGFCIYEVRVNGKVTTDEINSSAFEIDLSVYQFNIGDPVEVVIKHKDGCTPKVLNPDVLKPKSTFNLVSINVNKNGRLVWVTTNEHGSLPFIVEQKRWKKWIPIKKVDGKGTPGRNTYSVNVTFHSGINQFRVKQIDYTKRPRMSKVASYRSLMKPVTFTPGPGKKVTSKIIFSATTDYEIYDYFGKRRMKGRGKVVDVSKLPRGQYFLNYDNTTSTFEKK